MLRLFKRRNKARPGVLPPGQLVSIKAASEYIGIPVHTLRRVLHSRALAYYQFAGNTSKIWLHRQDIDAWLARDKRYHHA